jgi:Uma2 family endonuclease
LDAVWQEAAAIGLVIEVASDSTQDMDAGSKAIKYARADIPAYWRVAQDGTVTVDGLVRSGGYGLVTKVVPGQAWQATVPFPVTIEPEVLIA